jgi:hypothetical protein
VIFESDAAEPVTLTWTGADGLEVEIRRVTEVYQSLRSYKGIHITYRVTPNVMQNIADIEGHIGRNYIGKLTRAIRHPPRPHHDRRHQRSISRDPHY